jgi:hypothetical protein
MEVEFERDALFREVWASPISTLAKKYGLSDNGLRRVCIALAIPLPGRGHWAKVAVGHTIATPQLPPTNGRTRFVCRPAIELGIGMPHPKDDPVLAEQLAFEADPANAIDVAEVLLRPHPIVARTAKAVRAEIAGLEKSRTWRRQPQRPGARVEPDWSSFVLPSWNDYVHRGHIMELSDAVLPMRVSIETSSRALRIWDAVIKACVARGMQVAVEPRALMVSREGDWVRLRVSEKVDKAPVSARPNADLVRIATGSLRIFVIDRGETKFDDRPERSLDHQLNDVLRRIHHSMASLRFQRQVWAEERRRAEVGRQALELQRAATAERRRHIDDEERHREAERAALEAEHQAEIERERQLVIEANAWRQAETIRAYAAHVASAIAASGTPAGPELSAWLTWAAAVAERLDPTSKRLA